MTALSFDNISLIPRVISNVASRDDVDTRVQFGPQSLRIPFLASPMPDVMGYEMAEALYQEGALGFLHRFQPKYDQPNEYMALANRQIHVGVSVGIGDDWGYRVAQCYGRGARIFLIDVANGASERVIEVAKMIKKQYENIFLVAGNVASRQAFSELSQYVDAIRVGIAGGSVCTTGPSTGIQVPTLQSVYECSQEPREALIIADGGIRNAADACKAIALGADLVMCGSLFAGTKESPGPVVVHEGSKYKMYRGAASYGVQYQYGGTEPNYIEGSEGLVSYKGSVSKVLEDLENGLRSSMSYFGARTLQEYRQNVSWIEL